MNRISRQLIKIAAEINPIEQLQKLVEEYNKKSKIIKLQSDFNHNPWTIKMVLTNVQRVSNRGIYNSEQGFIQETKDILGKFLQYLQKDLDAIKDLENNSLLKK